MQQGFRQEEADALSDLLLRDPMNVVGLGIGTAARAMKPLGAMLVDAIGNAGGTAADQYVSGGGVNMPSVGLAGLLGAAPHAKARGGAVRSSMISPEERAANFKNWFGDSKVVDAEGKPLTVYHGTGSDLDQFDASGGKGKTFGTGAFFTGSTDVANTYTTGKSKNVMPVNLNLRTPAVFDAMGANWNRIPGATKVSLPKIKMQRSSADDELFRELGGNPEDLPKDVFSKKRSSTLKKVIPDAFQWGDETFSTDDLARWARKNGYDGVVVKNVIDRGPSGEYATSATLEPSTIYVAFDPTQIKSATGNRGTFDPNDPNITHLTGSAAPAARINPTQALGRKLSAGAQNMAIRKYLWGSEDEQRGDSHYTKGNR
jgi:hypothetical protein